MKYLNKLLIVLFFVTASFADEVTVEPAKSSFWGGNTGWINCAPSGESGITTWDMFISGYAWSPNLGWISLGDGKPNNGIQYTNIDGDYGVNIISDGSLRGCAYSGNVGWIVFEQRGSPGIDIGTGDFMGYAWSCNTGWINLSGVRVNKLKIVDEDSDGISDSWERSKSNGSITLLEASNDADKDGRSDIEEFIADTDPLNPEEMMRIISISRNHGNSIIFFTSKTSRIYQLVESPDLTENTWNDTGLGIFRANSDITEVQIADPTSTSMFYRVQCMRPLSSP